MNRQWQIDGCTLNFESYNKCKESKSELSEIDLWLQNNMAWLKL